MDAALAGFPTVEALWRDEQRVKRELSRRRRPGWGLPMPPVAWDPESGEVVAVTVREADVLERVRLILPGTEINPRNLRYWAQAGLLPARKTGAGRTCAWEYGPDAPWDLATYLLLARARPRWSLEQAAEARRLAATVYPYVPGADLDDRTLFEAGVLLRPNRLEPDHPLAWVVSSVWAPLPDRPGWTLRRELGQPAASVRAWLVVRARLLQRSDAEAAWTVRFVDTGDGYVLRARPADEIMEG